MATFQAGAEESPLLEMTSPGIRVRFYGRLAEEVQPELLLDGPSERLTVAELRRRLAKRFKAPALPDPRVRVVVGGEMALEYVTIGAGEEVELLAPLSGG